MSADNLITAENIPNLTVEELLLLVADEDRGYKVEAMDQLMAMGFKAISQTLFTAVRNDADADLRNGSMELLVRLGSDSLPQLTRLLKDDNEEVRNFAAVMLGDIGSNRAVGALINALGDPDMNVSHSAAEALGKIGDRAALLPLLELLKGDFWQQYAAITAISAMRDSRAVPQLINLLDNELLAGATVQTLGEIGDPRAIYPLSNILAYVDDVLAGQIAKALVAICRNFSETLRYKNSLTEFSQPAQLQSLISERGIAKLHVLLEKNSEHDTLEAVVTLLGWLGDTSALDAFYRLLADNSYMTTVENALLSLGKAATASLIAALDHENDNVRIVAIRSLRWLCEGGADKRLIELLASSNPAIQIEALESLKGRPIAGMLSALYELLLHDNPEISDKTAEALGGFPLQRIQPFLDELISSPDSEKRRRAATVLCYLVDEGVFKLLSRLAADHEPLVRREALLAGGRLKLEAALPLLGAALSDPDITVREAAIMALAEFGVPVFVDEIVAILGKDQEDIAYTAIKALGMMAATEAGTALMAYLMDERLSRNLEYAIIETLGKISCIAASRLISSRYLQHADADIRRLAVVTLGKLGDPHSLEGVEAAAQDQHWSVRVAVLQVLGERGGDKELPLLLAALEDRDYLVRKNAILVLGNLHNIATIPALTHQLTDAEMSRYAFEALLQFGRRALPWLHRLMTGNYPLELRIRVIDIIGKIADHKSVEPLLKLLDDLNPTVRLATIDSLAFCYDSLALKRLSNIQKNDDCEDVKDRAALALKTFMMEKYF